MTVCATPLVSRAGLTARRIARGAGLATAVCLSACAAAPKSPPPPDSSGPAYGTFGFDVAGMDQTVRAGDDFFAHANGGWSARVVIPPDRSSVNTFAMLRELASQDTAQIIAEAARAIPAEGTDAQKLGDYFATLMDETAIEKTGVTPLRPDLDRIAAIHTRADLARELGSGLRADVDALNSTDLYTDRPLGLWVAEDLTDTDRYMAYLMQGGLGMPDREYYLASSRRFVELRARYQQHVAAMLGLAGFDQPDRRARGVMELETAIARVHWSAAETTDVLKAHTRWRREDFARQAPGLDWDAFFTAADLADQAELVAWQSTAVAGIARLAGSEPLEVWKDYLAFHAISRAAPFLSRAFAEESFAFSGKALMGVPQQPARWKRAVDHTSSALTDAIGRIYVQRRFSPEAKAEVLAMVENIRAAFDARIAALEWMTPETKAEARAKLAAMRVGVGYPEKWRDYSALRIVPGDALGNAQRAELFEYRRNLARLRGPVDRSEWFLAAQDVNALNAPLQNSVIFPAAILQPPFFDPKADPAVNYGAIGGIIGHEISHGFDDTGALFDARGRLRNWWTPADMSAFRARSQALVDQYDAYRPLRDLWVNGKLTLGENIADLGGLAAAYDAWRMTLGGRDAPVIDGFSGAQRLFLGWAQNYRVKMREGALRRALVTDVHAPGEYRADTVRNLDVWYEAFQVAPGQRLHLAPERRVRIW